MMTTLTYKGISIERVDLKPAKWAGEEYREAQKTKMVILSKDAILSTKRGTSHVKLSEYPTSGAKPLLKGFVISTARGTATRIL